MLPPHNVRSSNPAFSLVELSIVLVILGLLTGGILAGQSLIRAAELRSITSSAMRYQTAINAFKDKYFALPGDMTNATAFWGDQATGTASCADATIPDGTPGTCNGNGDNKIALFTENYRIWQHLANAGMIEGNYLGYATSIASTVPPTVGSVVPAGKIANTYWTSGNLSQYSGTNFELGYSDLTDTTFNWLIYTGVNSGWWANGAAIKPEEAWNLDTKMDDGKPGYGKVRAGPNAPNCATTNVASTAVYATSLTTISCNNIGFTFN